MWKTVFKDFGKYSNSRLQLVEWIVPKLLKYEFETVLDLCGKIGVVSYTLKRKGKIITFNDYYQYNYYAGKALIENNKVKLVSNVTDWNDSYKYKDYISRYYKDIYYSDEENAWLDVVIQNILNLKNEYEKAIAFHALGQSCIWKQPYGLFNRKTFGYVNKYETDAYFKARWSMPFEDVFNKYVMKFNSLVYSNRKQNTVIQSHPLDIEGNYDLVFIDPVLMDRKFIKNAISNIALRYNFLEAIANYGQIPNNITTNYWVPYFPVNLSPWFTKDLISLLDKVFDKYQKSIIAIMVNDDGILSWDQVSRNLAKYKKNIKIYKSPAYHNRHIIRHSFLIIGS